MTESRMRTFWNERAREDALFFVDNRRPYGGGDLEEFFASAKRDLDLFLGELGATLQPSDTVVDLGCGVGRLTRLLAGRTHHVFAIDVSDEMLQRARDWNPGLDNVTWLLGDGVSLAGVEDASVDACVTAVTFQHIPDPEITFDYVREIGRVLRPGGWAAVQFSNDQSVHRPNASLWSRLRARAGRAPRGQHDPAWLGSFIELDAFRQAAADGGLDVEKITGEGTLFCCTLLRKRSG